MNTLKMTIDDTKFEIIFFIKTDSNLGNLLGKKILMNNC